MNASAARPVAAPVEVAVSYWSVVGAQLRKNRVAMAALGCARVLVALAVAAPLIAFNVPWILKDSDGLSAPIVERLFDRFLFPGGVDVFFNLLLVTGPVWWLSARIASTVARRRAGVPEPAFTTLGRVLTAVSVILLGAWTLFLLFGVVLGATKAGWALLCAGLPGAAATAWARGRGPVPRPGDLRRARFACLVLFVGTFVLLQGPLKGSHTLVDYRSEQPRIEASGGWLVFPPVAFHPDNVGEESNVSVERSLKRPDGANLLGCDMNGRDVAARILFGTRISLTIGVVAVAIYIAIGTFLGSIAGYFGKGWDLALSRLIEIMICFPTLFLILTIISVFDSRSIFLIMAVIGAVGWPGVARLVRGEFLRQRGLDYVTAARAQGVPQRRIVFVHVLPNCMGPVLVSATFGVAGAILTESGLAFLGLGDSTAASWGQMLADGRASGYWHLILAPGLAIFFVVTSFNLLGEGLRDALDPKLRR